MNKNAIKNYAVWARTELMKQVAQKAYEYDVTESSLPGYNTDNVNGRLLTGDEKKQLNELITEVKKNGYEHVIEEVAYTWFNRFIALRYMEVNNYLPQRIRVFTNDNNEFKPDLLTDAIHVELDGLDKQKVFDYIEENKQEELYKYLLLTLCNDMNQYLPDMFTSIKDYKTLLFPDNLLKEDSVLAKLITDIDEDSWTDQVQIIGWLYQYYNSELKDIVMKKKNYTKDDIPAATQLFTPDWIVRYMVENSLGRLYINKRKHEGIFADGKNAYQTSEERTANEKFISNEMGWKYYLPEAKQHQEVIKELETIELEHAKLKLKNLNNHLNELREESINKDLVTQLELSELNDLLKPLIKQARLLVQKYDVVITNPPYMPPSPKQKSYVQKNYPDSKSDLFAVFIEKCHLLTKKNAYQAMITMHSWMFLSSFEKLRNKLLINNTIINMAHLGARAFEDIGGEVVQTTAFVFDNANIKNYQSNFKRLVDYNSQDLKEIEFLSESNQYILGSSNFLKIPGAPISYWLSKATFKVFENKKLDEICVAKCGMGTSNNALFLRLWSEVDFRNIGFKYSCIEETKDCHFRWVPHDKGGEFRKWYGNQNYVVNFYNNAEDIRYATRNASGGRVVGTDYYFKAHFSWGSVVTNALSFRYFPEGFVFDAASNSVFMKNDCNLYIFLALSNSKVVNYFSKILNPTVNFCVGDYLKIPMIQKFEENLKVEKYAKEAINLSKSDWDSFETSWKFKIHPLVKNHVSTISEAYNLWSDECESRFNTLKTNEEELNRIFIDIYGLQDELDPYVEDKDVTVHKADLVRDVKSFISYAVGCMFGRYSLDVEGLAYAGGEWDSSKYSTFIPDADDIIPICDEEYFEDDIVTRFIEFVRVVYGTDTLEDNLSFIANALGGKGNPREVLRNYFLNDFFKDHCNTYQVTGSGKRPIYWLFDSGKKNGFKTLVYIHRYTPDLIARMRTGYIHPQQARYRTQVELLQSQIDDASSTSERVKLSKQLKKINEQLLELNKYEEVVHHWADKMEPMDLDDGVKANYAKFQELLAKIK